MILLDALYINQGGGKILLDYLIDVLERTGLQVFYLLDARNIDEKRYQSLKNKQFLKASIGNRHFFYNKNQVKFDKVLCFGNIPPPTKCKGAVYTYVQNLILLDCSMYNGLQNLLWKLKRTYFRLKAKNSDFFILQTDYGKGLLLNRIKIPPDNCLVIPFYKSNSGEIKIYSKDEKKYIYVSDGQPHKNHQLLLNAWGRVNKINPDLELHLTVDKQFVKVLDLIETLKKDGANIINHGKIAHDKILDLYSTSKFVIYPSLIESFGLGVIEALEYSCDLIAADLPYIHTVSSPSFTFNPTDEDEIYQQVLASTSKCYQPTQLNISNQITLILNHLKN